MKIVLIQPQSFHTWEAWKLGYMITLKAALHKLCSYFPSRGARSARTFCSSVHVIEHVSAQLILFNIEPDTLNIDPNKIEEALKSAIRAILPVHLYGHPCEMNTVSKLALNYELAAIDDSILELSA